MLIKSVLKHFMYEKSLKMCENLSYKKHGAFYSVEIVKRFSESINNEMKK